MPRLVLMRHAKSSWAEPGRHDHDRMLNARGRLAAPLMGAWLRETGGQYGVADIDRVIVSDAQRTRETWALLSEVWTGGRTVAFEPRIYEASEAALLAVLREAPADANSLFMIGHNPGMQELTGLLCDIPPPRFPTSAIAVLECPASWANLAPGTCQLLAYEEPKSLI